MHLYQKKTLSGRAIGQPAPLPAELVGLAQTSLDDLSWADPRLGYAGCRFEPVADPAPVPPPVTKVSKLDFWRLFTQSEAVAFNMARRQVAEMTAADYADPAKAGLVSMEVFLNLFDATDTIELDNADTIAGVGLLQTLGILTAPRVAQALAGERP